MSFKEYTSDVSICNMALDMVSESKTITSIDDPGINAASCRRWYKPIVAKLLETHHWGLATKRSTPVAIANPRGNEWLYAYATPDDMAFPVGFTLGNGTSTVSYFRGLAGLLGMLNGRAIFQYQNGVIYSHITGELDYVSYDITEAEFNATFANVVVLMLASRLALSLPKDFELSDALEKKATEQINMAITQNLNAGNPRYGQLTSESEMARGSGFGNGWDYIPSGFGV